MLYKDARRGAADIGEALRVDYLVEGSVRVGGDRVRITAQLIETRGETHLWAHSYDREYANCLAVQADVAAEIAVQLHARAVPAGVSRRRRRAVPGAHEAYLTGRFHWHRPGSVGLRTAIDFYDQALAHDPGFGRAHSSRARAFLSLSEYYVVDAGDALRTARDAAERALAIDPDDGDALVVVGRSAARARPRPGRRARRLSQGAVGLNPSSDCAHRYYAWFLGVRRRRRGARRRRPGLQPRPAVHRDADVAPPTSAISRATTRERWPAAGTRWTMEPDFERALRGRGRARWSSSGAAPTPSRSSTRSPSGRCRRPSLAVKGCALAAAGHADRARAIARRLERAGKDTRRVALSPRRRSTRRSATPTRRSRSWSAPAPAAIPGSTRSASIHASPACGDDRLHAIRARLRLGPSAPPGSSSPPR